MSVGKAVQGVRLYGPKGEPLTTYEDGTSEYLSATDPRVLLLLREIWIELKMIKEHLSFLSDVDITRKDV
jgi:hypothetical protein